MTIGSGGLSQRSAVLRYLGARAAARLRLARPEQRGTPEVRASDLFVDRGGLQALLAVTRGPAARDGDTLPGWIPGIWEAPLVPELLRAAGYPFPFRGVLNLGVQRSVLNSPVVDERHSVRLTLAASEPIRSGEKLTVDSTLLDARGEERIRSRSWFLLRRPPADGRTSTRRESAAQPGQPIVAWDLTPADARRYADLSGDRNPVHLGGLAGRLLGFPQPILHGACLEALTWNALAAEVGIRAEGDFSIRFERPVVLPATVSLRAEEYHGPQPAAFTVVGADAARPYASGFHAPRPSDPDQG